MHIKANNLKIIKCNQIKKKQKSRKSHLKKKVFKCFIDF